MKSQNTVVLNKNTVTISKQQMNILLMLSEKQFGRRGRRFAKDLLWEYITREFAKGE